MKALVSDLSRTLLFPTDKEYTGTINGLHKSLIADPNYDFWSTFILDEQLLAFYKELSKDYDLFMLTSDSIQEYPSLKQKLEGIFREIFNCFDLGMSKSDPETYVKTVQKVGMPASEIVYVDDNEENIKMAKSAGMQVVQALSSDQTIAAIKELL